MKSDEAGHWALPSLPSALVLSLGPYGIHLCATPKSQGIVYPGMFSPMKILFFLKVSPAGLCAHQRSCEWQ